MGIDIINGENLKCTQIFTRIDSISPYIPHSTPERTTKGRRISTFFIISSRRLMENRLRFRFLRNKPQTDRLDKTSPTARVLSLSSVSYKSTVSFSSVSTILRRLYLFHVPAPSTPSAPGFGFRAFFCLRSIAKHRFLCRLRGFLLSPTAPRRTGILPHTAKFRNVYRLYPIYVVLSPHIKPVLIFICIVNYK